MNFMRHHSFYVSAEEKVFRSVAAEKWPAIVRLEPYVRFRLFMAENWFTFDLRIGMSFNFSDLDDKISTISMPVVNLK